MIWSNADVDIRYLRVFVAIVESGGFTQAQLALGLSQSTISNQIGSLEESLGFKLCERGRSGFRLTLKGKVVYESAVELFGVLDDFREGMSGLKKVMLGRLRIGLLHGVRLGCLPDIVHAIRTYNLIAPDVALELSCHRQDELEHALLKGNLDIAIGGIPPDDDFSRHSISIETYQLAAPTDHPVHDVANLDQAEFARHRFASSAHLAAIERGMLPEIRPAAITSGFDEKLALMRAGQLLGYLPAEMLSCGAMDDIRALPGNLYDLHLPLVLFRRKTRGNRIVRVFFECVFGKIADR